MIQWLGKTASLYNITMNDRSKIYIDLAYIEETETIKRIFLINV